MLKFIQKNKKYKPNESFQKKLKKQQEIDTTIPGLQTKITEVKQIRRTGYIDLSNAVNNIDVEIRKNKNFLGGDYSVRSLKNRNANFLWVIFWVKKFIEILKSEMVINKLKKLKQFHWEIIDDKSYFPHILMENKAKKVNNPLFEKMVNKYI